jgi:hypothetical protein
VAKKSKIGAQDILDISWKYFQQHAQQRISYFNFFVLFAIFMTTGILTTFQEKYSLHFVGTGIGVLQAIISIIFLKIDSRNKFLTSLSENAIKEIEKKYKIKGINSETIKIFTSEDNYTRNLKNNQVKNFFIFRQLSHGKAYKHIYWFFFVVGISGAIGSGLIHFFKTDTNDNKMEIGEKLFQYKFYQDKKQIDQLIKKSNVLELDIKSLNNKLDSLSAIIGTKIKQNTND